MNILDHPLVRKYFGECVCGEDCDTPCRYAAIHILRAMQQPISEGDRVLISEWKEKQCWSESIVGREVKMLFDATQEYHPGYLRLPDKFQPKKEREHPNQYREVKVWCDKHLVCGASPKPAPEQEMSGMSRIQGLVSHPASHPNMSSCPNCRPSPVASDEVEEKIKAFAYKLSSKISSPYKQVGEETEIEYFEKELRSLVKLARGME